MVRHTQKEYRLSVKKPGRARSVHRVAVDETDRHNIKCIDFRVFFSDSP